MLKALRVVFQIDAYVKTQTDGLQIVGYYQADSVYGATELGKTGKTIAERLHQQCKASCALLVSISMQT